MNKLPIIGCALITVLGASAEPIPFVKAAGTTSTQTNGIPPATAVNQIQLVKYTDGNSVWTLPYGLSGSQYVGSTNDYVGKDIQLVQQMTYNNVVWYQFSVNGNVVGWLDSRTLSDLTNIQQINQPAVMGYTTGNSIWTIPYGVPGSQYVDSTNKYAFRDVTLTESAQSGSTQWYKVSVNGQSIGWIDAKALDTAGQAQSVNFNVVIGSTYNNGIWSVPYGIDGTQYLGSTNDFAYQTVQVVKQVTMGGVTWYLIEKNGNFIGWIDSGKALTDLTNIKDENRTAMIASSNSGDAIWSAPYGEFGAQFAGFTSDYLYQTVQVVQSATKGTTTWDKIMVGDRVLGWVDNRVLTDVPATTDVNINQLIKSTTGNAVWSSPYGFPDAKYIGPTNDYVGKDIKLIKQMTFNNVVWYQFSINGNVIGWLDSRVLSDVTNIQQISQDAVMGATTGNAIWTMPYGVPGTIYLGSTNKYAYRDIKLIESVLYNNVQWYKISVDGQPVGWIDGKALDTSGLAKTVNFNVTIGSTPGNGIWTSPYGIDGTEYVASTNDYALQTVQVIKQVTLGGITWDLVQKDGKVLGWIDSGKALTNLTINNENYTAMMGFSNKGDGIWSVPYGQYGAQFVDYTNNYTYLTVQVVQSTTIGSTTWDKIMLDNRVLGWVDSSVFSSASPLNTYTQLDPNGEVHYNWNNGGPFSSQQYLGDFTQNKTLSGGDYFAQTFADDGIKVSFDSASVIDRWTPAAGQTDRAIIPNVPAGNHTIHTHYFQNGGNAAVFSDVVPFGSWLAYYYPNTDLSGYPVAAKVLPQGSNGGLSDDNGYEGSPAQGVSGTNYSARYVTAQHLKAGQYLLTSGADDGERIYVDGQLVVDKWGYNGFNEQSSRLNISDNPNAANGMSDVHWITVEYMQGTGYNKVTATLKPTYTFVDVSHWDGTVDWNAVKQSGISAAYVKATEGTTMTDDYYLQNVRNAAAAGIPVGAYHFAHPEYDTAFDEAMHFVSVLNQAHTDLMPVLDLESPSGPTSTVDGTYVTNWARDFINYVQQATGRRVMLYTGRWYINGFGISGLSDVPIWVAKYSSTLPTTLSDWNGWNSWQYTETGSVNGINASVDLSVTTSLDGLR